MERVEHRIRLDLMKTGLQGQVNVKKADTDSRKVCIYLSYAAKPFDLDDVVSAVLRAEKPDGNVMFNSCTVCEDRLEYIITTQTIASIGTVTCEITLTSGSGQVLVTPRFEIIVSETIYSDSEIESTNEYTALTKAMEKAANLKDGITPTIGENGNWYLGETDTGKPSRGLQGEKGATGANGKSGKDGTDGNPGADGLTPTIGDNGNWYLGNVDTGKPSRGLQGEKGASTAADVSYEPPEEVQTEFPEIELEENTVKAGLDIAMYYALAGMYAKYIQITLQGAAGTVDVSLQNFINNTYIPVANEAHEHNNKNILDEITAEKVNIWDNKQAKPSQVTTGTAITLADNTEYRLTDVTTLTLTYPEGNFECWLCVTFAASGTVTVTLPIGTKYLGSSPDFKNGEVWEVSIKDGVVVAQKVGDGI